MERTWGGNLAAVDSKNNHFIYLYQLIIAYYVCLVIKNSMYDFTLGVKH